MRINWSAAVLYGQTFREVSGPERSPQPGQTLQEMLLDQLIKQAKGKVPSPLRNLIGPKPGRGGPNANTFGGPTGRGGPGSVTAAPRGPQGLGENLVHRAYEKAFDAYGIGAYYKMLQYAQKRANVNGLTVALGSTAGVGGVLQSFSYGQGIYFSLYSGRWEIGYYGSYSANIGLILPSIGAGLQYTFVDGPPSVFGGTCHAISASMSLPTTGVLGPSLEFTILLDLKDPSRIIGCSVAITVGASVAPMEVSISLLNYTGTMTLAQGAVPPALAPFLGPHGAVQVHGSRAPAPASRPRRP